MSENKTSPEPDPPLQSGDNADRSNQPPKTEDTTATSSSSGRSGRDTKNQPLMKSPDGKWTRTQKKLGYGSFKSVYLAIGRDGGEVAWNVIKLGKMGQSQKKKVHSKLYSGILYALNE